MDHVTVLSAFCEKWLSPKSPRRERATQILVSESGFPKAMCEEILRRIFTRALVALEPSAHTLTRWKEIPTSIGFVFPANVPDPIVDDLIPALATQHRCLIKFSREFTRFGRYFLECLMKDNAQWKSYVRVVSQTKFLNEMRSCAVLCAYGREETLNQIQGRLENQPLKRFGNRFGVSICVGGSRQSKALVERCARDIWMYDQKGCLSPQVIFVPQGQERHFGLRLKRALDRLNKVHGTCRRSFAQRLSKRAWIDRFISQTIPKPHELMSDPCNLKDAFVYVSDSAPLPGPGGLVVGIQPYRSLTQLKQRLKRVRPMIQCIGVGGSLRDLMRVKAKFRTWSVKRVCPAGEMQRPPAGWNDEPLTYA